MARKALSRAQGVVPGRRRMRFVAPSHGQREFVGFDGFPLIGKREARTPGLHLLLTHSLHVPGGGADVKGIDRFS